MFKDIFLFEISFRLKRISTYVYFGIWFLMGFIYMSSDSVLQLGIGTKVAKNSPYGISQLLALLTAFGTPIISAVTGTAIYRDFEERMHLILFSTPISKFGYLGGRLFGSLFSTFIIFIGIPIGMFLGTLMPWADSTKLAPFSLMSYLQPFLLIVIPNILFLGTLFFLVGTLTRNILAVYLQGVVVFAIYLISLNLIGDVNNQFTPALLDPFGLITIDSITKYWTVADRNNLLLPISGVMLYNRLLWSLLA
ncbi:MAG: hypothetical protein JNN15_15100, partial [Blastocatellia bacterium]|nr:hypothetical protein [Blastocatellia bacterium]